MNGWEKMFEHLLVRLDGPLHFRLFLQPAMALFFGIRDGIQDAREGRTAYLYAVIMHPSQARDLLKAGFKSVARVVILALIMESIYQIIVSHWVYPGEALLVTFTLAFVPYLLIRGPVNRIARRLPSLTPPRPPTGAKE